MQEVLERITGYIFWHKGVLPKHILQPYNRPFICLQETRTSQEARIWTANQGSWAWCIHPSGSLYTWWHGKGGNNLLQMPCRHDSPEKTTPYSAVMGWLRCRLSMASLRASIMCIRGSRSSFHHGQTLPWQHLRDRSPLFNLYFLFKNLFYTSLDFVVT